MYVIKKNKLYFVRQGHLSFSVPQIKLQSLVLIIIIIIIIIIILLKVEQHPEKCQKYDKFQTMHHS
jgi:hypothetical protein